MSFYEICKALGQVVFNAVLGFIVVIGKEFGWNTEIIMKIGSAFIVMWNSIIIIWNKEYYKNLANEVSTQEEGV